MSIRGMGLWGTLLPPKLEGQTGGHRETQLRVESQELKHPWKPLLE